ncbi:MAG: DUF177 domain-containing protein [Geobacter sp.]|nr:DUF177 domain-containing protein [Geobacter sp.]
MKVAVDRIQSKPLAMHIEEPVEKFTVLEGMQKDQVCRFTGPITCDLTATRDYDNIQVNGRVSVPLSLSCSRCLVDYDSHVDTNFMVIFRKDSEKLVADGDEVELGELDLLSSTYQGDEIDLMPEIEEQVAMEIPLKPLCSESCKGLCHQCGIDLNLSQCSCSNETTSFAFSALKDFKVSKIK